MIVDDNIEILDEYMDWENQVDDPMESEDIPTMGWTAYSRMEYNRSKAARLRRACLRRKVTF